MYNIVCREADKEKTQPKRYEEYPLIQLVIFRKLDKWE